jgi:hypothetical protein
VETAHQTTVQQILDALHARLPAEPQ